MATDQDLANALKRAAENLVNRSLTEADINRLVDNFKREEGTARQKAREALRKFAGLTEQELSVKSAASDNTDRLIVDLQQTADNWKPNKP